MIFYAISAQKVRTTHSLTSAGGSTSTVWQLDFMLTFNNVITATYGNSIFYVIAHKNVQNIMTFPKL